MVVDTIEKCLTSEKTLIDMMVNIPVLATLKGVDVVLVGVKMGMASVVQRTLPLPSESLAQNGSNQLRTCVMHLGACILITHFLKIQRVESAF